MPYLYNKHFQISRESGTVDEYGGYGNVTGTILYPDQIGRMDHYIPSQWLTRNQGLETEQTFTVFLHWNWQNAMDIRENDVVTLIFPPTDPYYNKRFRIRGKSFESNHPNDPRGLIELSVTRIEENNRTPASI